MKLKSNVRAARAFATMLSCVFSLIVFAQEKVIEGDIKSSSGNTAVPKASIRLRQTNKQYVADENGHFHFTASQSFPFVLIFSSIGFETKEVTIQNEQVLAITLEEEYHPVKAVVVAASRLKQQYMQSPVSIEKISAKAIPYAVAPSYYDLLLNLKGVDVTTSGMGFKTISTRGFNLSGNNRFNQLIDNISGEIPSLNFPLGGFIGLAEPDVESMELLSGASSALYGSGGMNGTLLINSKNPFDYEGLSVQVKQGVNHLSDANAKAAPYYDWSARWAKKLSDKFAFKLTAQYIEAKDWIASDSSNYYRPSGTNNGYVIPGNRLTDPNYDGVNVYGDETTLDIKGTSTPFLQGVISQLPDNQKEQAMAILQPYLAGNAMNVSRTGYKESEVINPKTWNLKLAGGLYYKLSKDLEASVIANYTKGTTAYTGGDRFALRGFSVGQYKLEVKSSNWQLRTYTTQTNSGDTYNATITSRVVNEGWKPSYNPQNPAESWYPQYAGAFVQTALTIYQQAYQAAIGAGQSAAAAAATAQTAMLGNTNAIQNNARQYADNGRPVAGSKQFNDLLSAVRKNPIPQGGLFLDRSDLYQTEGQYNLTQLLGIGKEAQQLEVLVGGNWKHYVLNSKGTLFADKDGPIGINEWGTYLQLARSFFDNHFKLTATGRYDKNQNFKGRFTPRFTGVITVAKDHYVRMSYQTAYRFPTTQQQWVDLEIGGGTRLIGGLPYFRDKYNYNTNPWYTLESVLKFQQSAQGGGTPDPSLLKVYQFNDFKPESVQSYELGYKGMVTPQLLVDVYAYYARYKDFIGRVVTIQNSSAGAFDFANSYSFAANSSNKVNTRGWGLSLDYTLPANFFAMGNVYSDEIKDVPKDFIAGYNTPKYRFNIGFGNKGMLKDNRYGFSVTCKWQDAFLYEGEFARGQVAAFTTIDAQVSYKILNSKSLIKIGATNLTNHYYTNAFANPAIGGLYYVSYGYNIL